MNGVLAENFTHVALDDECGLLIDTDEVELGTLLLILFLIPIF